MQAFPSVEELRTWVDGLEELARAPGTPVCPCRAAPTGAGVSARVDESDGAQERLKVEPNSPENARRMACSAC